MPEFHARTVWWIDSDDEDEVGDEPEEADSLSREDLVSELVETIRGHFEASGNSAARR